MYTAVYDGGGLYRIFYDGQPIGMLDVRSIDWSKVTIVKESEKGENRMQIVNLTPHTINLMPAGPTGPVVTIPPSGQVARCATYRVQAGTVTVDGISVPVNQTRFGEVDNLPEPQPDTIYIVSALVAQAAPDRSDVFVVDDTVRDDQGRIIGARALAHV